MPLLLLVGAAVGGAYWYSKTKSKLVPLAQVAPVAAATPVQAAADNAAAVAAMALDAGITDGSADPTTAAAFAQVALPAGSTDTSSTVLPADAASDFSMNGLRGLRGFGGHQPSGALPGMGTYHSRMRTLTTGGRSRGPLAGFAVAHVFDTRALVPALRAQGLSGLGFSFHSVTSAIVNTAKAAVAAPAKVVSAIAAPIEAITGAGGLKVPLAIATMGSSLLLNAGAKAAVGVTNAVSNTLLKPLNKIGGTQTAQPATATTDCNGYATGQVVYKDGTGATTDCASWMSALNILQSQSSVALSIQPIGTAPAVFQLPSPLTVAQILAQGTAAATQINPATGLPYTQGQIAVNPATGLPYTNPALTAYNPGNGYPTGTYPSIGSTTQINPLTGGVYPIGTPINPSTGAAYINPASGTAWPAGTVIDQVTGYPMGVINPATGVAYPAVNVPNTSAGLTATTINPATGLPYSATTINPATGLPYTTATINPMTGLPYPTVASPSDPTSVASTTQINPMTGVAYPPGTPINPSTGQAYMNPLTGVAWPPYTVIDQYTGYPISAINPSTGTYYPINQALIASAGTSATLLAQQQAAYGQYGPGGSTDPSYGTDYTQDPGMSPNPAIASGGGIDPATGIPYSQEQAPAPAAPAAAATPAAPVASKPVNWWMVGGAAVGVPALMYFMHK